jgi:hypothetical protein
MLSHQDIIKMNKKILISFGMILLISILMINLASAVYCCERLKTNPEAWCQESEQKENCATGVNPFSKTNELYKSPPIACESTSFCSTGTCVDQQEGTCKSSSQVTCSVDGGIWKKEKKSDLGECQLGCCLLNNEISFVTLTRCKKLSSDAGIETNYRSDIQSESECILSVTSDEKGACVYEEEYQRTCRMTTQSECRGISESEFHIGYLCSAQQLTTNCGPSRETTCINEDVYFLDTCGNPANIYDSSKINDNNYWTSIQEPTCGDGSGNKNSKTCGTCDYFSGSTCKAYGGEVTTKAAYGDYICSSLDCEGHSHGETWCEENSKSDVTGQNLPGSRYFRMMCYDGEIIVQPCAEYRNEICRESEVEGFSTGACTINRWQECILQVNKTECEDVYARDCKWISGYSIMKDANGTDLGFTDINGHKLPGSCVPKYTPGLNFWEGGEGTGSEVCAWGSTTCIVQYEIGIFRNKDNFGTEDWATKKKKCVKNCQCIPDGSTENKYWTKTLSDICTSLGDCGNKKNYFGLIGETKQPFTSEFVKKP